MNRLTRRISEQFKKPSGIMGAMISLIQNIVNAEMYRSMISILNITPEEKVLDIGCGNGHLLKMIDRKTRADLYGIDISDDALMMTKRRNRNADHCGRLHLKCADCCSLPFEENSFSAVTSINTIYFWSDPVQGFREILRTLQPGRQFYNIAYTIEYLNTIRYTQSGYCKYTPEQLKEFGRAAGFRKAEVREIRKAKSFIVIYTK